MIELGKLYRYVGEMDKDIHPVDPTLEDRYIEGYEDLMHGSLFVLLEHKEYALSNIIKAHLARILTTSGTVGWVYIKDNQFVEAKENE